MTFSGVSVPAPFSQGFLSGGGELGALMRVKDWSTNRLGPVEQWPQSLRTSVSTCLNSRFAIVIWWGPEFVMLYNDAYREIIASKHPAALGNPGFECWPEIWDTISPMLEGVIQRSEATLSHDLLLLLERHGYPEECYFTFSYSPIRDESGRVGGVFTPVIETTERVIAERRLNTLRELAGSIVEAKSEDRTWALAAEILGKNRYDIPFSVLYAISENLKYIQAKGCAGLDPNHVLCDGSKEISKLDSSLLLAISDALVTGEMVLVENLEQHRSILPRDIWRIPPVEAVALPVVSPGHSKADECILLGLNPHKRFDKDYRVFLETVGRQFGSNLAAARAYDEETKRAKMLAELDHAKTAFFSNVSHEFRTPLTLMVGPIETMLERAHPSTTVSREELQLVHRNSMRLLKLVNNLLDFSRIEAGRVQAVYEPTDLSALTADIASAFRSVMEQAGLQFVIDCPPLPEPAYVDREMWEKIVLNLISNAFKFTVAGRVTVRTKSVPGQIELTVEDTGPGIPEEQQSKVFERFHRMEGMRGRTHEGTGIGLALVLELAKLHGGSIRLESAVGKGSKFVVSVPKGRAHLAAANLSSQPMLKSTGGWASVYVDEALGWLPEIRSKISPLQVFAADSVQAPHIQTTTGRILLADDNSDMRGYVRRLLGESYEVETVSNGVEALAAVRRSPPDLVLTDVMMPELDGFGLLRELRANESTGTIPVILLSARAGEDARVEGLEAGADDYIVKPFTARELLARVGAHLDLCRVRREAAERERALRADAEAANERTSTMLESISDSFFALNRQWRFKYVNAAAEQSLKIKRDDLIGREFWEVVLPVSDSVSEMQYRRSMTEGVSIHFENYYPPWGRWYEIRLYPAGDGGISVFYHDISDRKRLAKSERLAAVGTLARGVAHFFNNEMQAIQFGCYLLRQSMSASGASAVDETRGCDFIERIEKASRRSSEIAGRLLQFSQAEMLRPSRFAPGPLLEEVVPELRLVAGERIEVTTSIATDLPDVELDANKLKESIFVLARNAWEVIPEGGKLAISLSEEEVDASRAQQLGLVPSRFVLLSIADTGPGLDNEAQSHVFEPFFTTKGRAQVEGLGLASIFGFIRQSGGTITVRSTPKRGATFDLYLPTVLRELD